MTLALLPLTACYSIPDERALLRLHDEWSEAWMRKDAAAADRIAAPGFVYVGPDGAAMDRAAVLGMIRAPGYRIHEGWRGEYEFRVLTLDSAALRFRWRGRGELDEQWWSDDHRCTMIFTRAGRNWRAAYEHCSANFPQ